MKTPSGYASSHKATKPKRILRSALAKKKSTRDPKLKKKVQFDLRMRFTPSNEALCEESIGQCRTDYSDPYRPDGMRLRSYSCDNVVEAFPCNTTKPWQSVTCLAPPPSPNNVCDHSSPTSQTVPACNNQSRERTILQSRSFRLLAKGRISRKADAQFKGRCVSKRMPTPRWVCDFTQLPQQQTVPGFSCAIVNKPHYSKDVFSLTNIAMHDDYSVVSGVYPRSSTLMGTDKGKSNEKRFVVDDLSMKIGKLQIAAKNTKLNSWVRSFDRDLSSAAQHKPKELDGFVEMDPGIHDPYDRFETYDGIGKDSGGNTMGDSDKNNNSVENKSNQEIPNKTHVSSNNSAFLPSTTHSERTGSKTLSYEDFDKGTCSSSYDCYPAKDEAVDDGEEQIVANTCHHGPINSPLSHNKPRSFKAQKGGDFLLHRTCSVDSVLSETFSGCSTLNDNIKILVDPEEDIDEDFWRVVCPHKSADHLVSQSAHNSLDSSERTPALQVANLTSVSNEDAQHDALCSESYGKGPSGSPEAHLGISQGVDEEHSNATQHQVSILKDHGSYTIPFLSQSELHVTSSTSPPCVTVLSPTVNTGIQYQRDRQPSPNAKDISASTYITALEVIPSTSEPTNIPDQAEDCATRETGTEPSGRTYIQSHKSGDSTQHEGTIETDRIVFPESADTEVELFTENPSAEENRRHLLMCYVLNCGRQFSQPSLLSEHLSQMDHSPCNPLATIVDGLEPSGSPMFLCPHCGETFETETGCQDHMFQRNHARLMLPVQSCVYTCPECLRFFSDISSARHHMEDLCHHGYAFYFVDDAQAPNRGQPIPVPYRLMRELVSRCARVSHCLVCQDCGQGLSDPDELRYHLDSRHIVAAKCCTSVRDVFADLLTDQACAECGQFIYQGLPPTGMCLHTGCPLRGPVLAWRARTLREFLLRCGIADTCVGTELTLDCVPHAPCPASPLVLEPSCHDSEEFGDEAARGDINIPLRSLSESALPAWGDIVAHADLHIEPTPENTGFLSCERTENFSRAVFVALPTCEDVSTGAVDNGCSSLLDLKESVENVDILHCSGKPCAASSSAQPSYASTSAACNSSTISQLPSSSVDIQSSSTCDPRGSAREVDPFSSNSGGSYRKDSLISSGSSNRMDLQPSQHYTVDMESDEEDGGNGIQSICSRENPLRVKSDASNEMSERVRAKPSETNLPTVIASPEMIFQRNQKKDTEKSTADNSWGDHEENLHSEARIALSSESLGESTSKPLPYASKKMVFGSEASLDINFFSSRPKPSSSLENARDQSTQVELTDGLESGTTHRANCRDFQSQTSVSAASRLTSTTIPQTDIILVSALDKSSDDSNEDRDDAAIRYVVIRKRKRQFKTSLRRRKPKMRFPYKVFQNSTLYCKVTDGKRIVCSKVYQRGSASVKNHLGFRKKISKGFHFPNAKALFKRRDAFTLRSRRNCRQWSPQSTCQSSSQQAQVGLNCSTSKKTETTYMIVNHSEGRSSGLYNLDSNGKGLTINDEQRRDVRHENRYSQFSLAAQDSLYVLTDNLQWLSVDNDGDVCEAIAENNKHDFDCPDIRIGQSCIEMSPAVHNGSRYHRIVNDDVERGSLPTAHEGGMQLEQIHFYLSQNTSDAVEKRPLKVENINLIEHDTNDQKANQPSDEESRYCIVKNELDPTDNRLQRTSFIDSPYVFEEGRFNLNELNADESRYFILTRKPSGDCEQNEHSVFNIAGPSKSSRRFKKNSYTTYSHGDIKSQPQSRTAYHTSPTLSHTNGRRSSAMSPLRSPLASPKYSMPLAAQAQPTGLRETPREQHNNLGFKLALRTKLVETEVTDSEIKREFGCRDRFIAVGGAADPQPLNLGESSGAEKPIDCNNAKEISSDNINIHVHTRKETDKHCDMKVSENFSGLNCSHEAQGDKYTKICFGSHKKGTFHLLKSTNADFRHIYPNRRNRRKKPLTAHVIAKSMAACKAKPVSATKSGKGHGDRRNLERTSTSLALSKVNQWRPVHTRRENLQSRQTVKKKTPVSKDHVEFQSQTKRCIKRRRKKALTLTPKRAGKLKRGQKKKTLATVTSKPQVINRFETDEIYNQTPPKPFNRTDLQQYAGAKYVPEESQHFENQWTSRQVQKEDKPRRKRRRKRSSHVSLALADTHVSLNEVPKPEDCSEIHDKKPRLVIGTEADNINVTKDMYLSSQNSPASSNAFCEINARRLKANTVNVSSCIENSSEASTKRPHLEARPSTNLNTGHEELKQTFQNTRSSVRPSDIIRSDFSTSITTGQGVRPRANEAKSTVKRKQFEPSTSTDTPISAGVSATRKRRKASVLKLTLKHSRKQKRNQIKNKLVTIASKYQATDLKTEMPRDQKQSLALKGTDSDQSTVTIDVEGESQDLTQRHVGDLPTSERMQQSDKTGRKCRARRKSRASIASTEDNVHMEAKINLKPSIGHTYEPNSRRSHSVADSETVKEDKDENLDIPNNSTTRKKVKETGVSNMKSKANVVPDTGHCSEPNPKRPQDVETITETENSPEDMKSSDSYNTASNKEASTSGLCTALTAEPIIQPTAITAESSVKPTAVATEPIIKATDEETFLTTKSPSFYPSCLTDQPEPTTTSKKTRRGASRPPPQRAVSQVAPRLARSLMLSLDGPSTSRSSLISRPSSTSVATSTSTPMEETREESSQRSPAPRHPSCRKLRTPKIQQLSRMSSIVFADLENFMFFKHFRGHLPPLTFVWGFVSARPTSPFHREKYFRKYELYRQLKSAQCTHVSTDIGFGKDAVDFTMTLALAKLDDRLPPDIPFYIVSNDGGFREVENQMRRATRKVKVVAPRRHYLTSAGLV